MPVRAAQIDYSAGLHGMAVMASLLGPDSLPRCEPSADGQHSRRRDGFGPGGPILHEFRGPPGDDDENADQRNIGIAVGHRLYAHLHQADHRHQRAQIPAPADEEEGPDFGKADRGHADRGQGQADDQDVNRAAAVGIWVNGRKG